MRSVLLVLGVGVLTALLIALAGFIMARFAFWLIFEADSEARVITLICLVTFLIILVAAGRSPRIIGSLADYPRLEPLKKGKPAAVYTPGIYTLAYWDIVIVGHRIDEPECIAGDAGEYESDSTTLLRGLPLASALAQTADYYCALRANGCGMIESPAQEKWCVHDVFMRPSEECFDTKPHELFACGD